MMHPEAAAVQMTAGGAQSNVLGFDPQVIPNDKHKILLERYPPIQYNTHFSVAFSQTVDLRNFSHFTKPKI
jgi:hypothetical protein